MDMKLSMTVSNLKLYIMYINELSSIKLRKIESLNSWGFKIIV